MTGMIEYQCPCTTDRRHELIARTDAVLARIDAALAAVEPRAWTSVGADAETPAVVVAVVVDSVPSGETQGCGIAGFVGLRSACRCLWMPG